MKKIILSVLAFVAIASSASAATNEELVAQYSAGSITLAELIAGITANSAATTTTTTATTTTFTYTGGLIKVGSRGQQVKDLQNCLNRLGNTTGVADGIFGRHTKAGVQSFQAAHGLVADGIIGPKTGPKFQEACVVTDTTTGTTTGDTTTGVTGDKIVVSGVASDDMFVGNAQKAVFSKLTVEAGDKDVKIKDIKVKATGSAAEGIDVVYVLDSAKAEIDSDSSADSNDEYKLDADVVVKAHQKATLYIAGKTVADVSGFEGLPASLEVTNIITDGADVEGLPIAGASHTLNQHAGSDNYVISVADENPTNVALGSTGVEFAKVTVKNPSAGSDDFTLRSLKIKETGSIDEEDNLDNVALKADGKTYEGDYSSHEYTFDFGTDGLTVEDGEDLEFMLSADVKGGAGKDIKFEVTDVVIEDEDGILLSPATTPASTYGPTTASVENYGINISATTDVTTGNVAAGDTGVKLASFEATVAGGEDMTGKMNVRFVATGFTAADADKMSLSNVAIYDEDGNKVSSVEDVDFATSGANVDVEFSDVVLKASDDAVKYFIKGDVNEDALNASTYKVAQLGDGTNTYFDIDVNSGEDISAVTAATTFTAVKTVKGAALALAVLSTIDDQTVKAGKDQAEVAVVQLDAVASGKDIDVKKLSLNSVVTDTVNTHVNTINDLDNCKIYDGNKVVSNTVDVNSANEVFNLSGVTVTAGTIKALSVKCDIADTFDPTDKIQVNLDTTVTNDEVKDGSEDVTPTIGANTAADIVITAASLTDANDAEPATVAVRTGQTVELGTVKLDPTDVDGTIVKLPLEIDGVDQLNPERKVEVYAGSTKVADAYFNSASIVVDNWTAPLTVADGSTTKLTFKAKLADAVASEGAALKVNIHAAADGIEMDNGDKYDATATTLTGVKVYSGLAKVEKDTTTAQAGSNKVVMKFKITAEGEDIYVAALAATSPSKSTGADAGTLTVHEGTSYADAEGNAAQAALTIDAGETRYFVVKGSAVTIDTGEFINIDVDLNDKLDVKTSGNHIDPVEGSDVETNEHISQDLVK